jgi:hypothetical protein
MRLSRLAFLVPVLWFSIGVAAAGNFSYTGAFSQDDDLQVFLFTAPSSSTVVRTWSYAGGTNAAGQVILPGGFDPILSVFDATGGLVASSLLVDSNNDGTGVDTDPVTGSASDSLLLLNALNPGGIYALILTQNDNTANGPDYGSGFNRDGQGNFTAGAFGCPGTDPFCDPAILQRNGQWAVDILGVDDATEVTGAGTVPEPGTTLLLFTGLSSLVLLGRRKRRS